MIQSKVDVKPALAKKNPAFEICHYLGSGTQFSYPTKTEPFSFTHGVKHNKHA